MVVLMLACAYESIYFVPCDLAKTPPSRVDFICADSGVQAILSWRGESRESDFLHIHAEDLLEGLIPGLEPNSNLLGLALPSPVKARRAPDASTPIYAIYTSGSTGQPKGVVMEHSFLTMFAKIKAEDERIVGQSEAHEASRVLLASTFTFDLCEGDLFGTLLAGATLVVAPRDALLHDLALVLGRSRATHLTLTPSLFSLVGDRHGPQDFPCLTSLCLGGEPMARATIAR